ncbi:MAG: hypothetical protein ACI80V_000134 [Rhodothermales bacterium]|jgi:hypothetical protein
MVTLSRQGYAVTYPVPIFLDLTNATAGTVARVEIEPGDVNVSPGDTLQFTSTGFNMNAVSIPWTTAWSATGGVIDQTGQCVAGPDAGDYEVRATDGATGVFGLAQVQEVLEGC